MKLKKLPKCWISWGFRGWAGTAGDEYGRQTYYLGIYGLGVVVVAGRFFTFDDILNDEFDWISDSDQARRNTRTTLEVFSLQRRIYGAEPPLEGEPDFSQMTDDQVLDWRFPE